MSAKSSDVQAWLAKAQSDLLSAQVLAANKPAILDTACFHCQQAGEKSLKAYLVFKDVEFEKTHSMSYLIGLCVKQNADFAKVQDQAELLDPYAVEARHPGDAIMPPVDEVDEALAAAKAIWDFVLTQLPPEDCLSSEKVE